MFLPVSINVGAGGQARPGYSRIIETSAKFDQIAAEARDMRVPLGRVGQDLHMQISAAFATKGATGATGRWRQLSPDYGTWKAKHSSAPLLVGLRPVNKGTRENPTRPQSYVPSGTMRRQLLVPLTDAATWHVDARRLLYTPLSDIAGFHETGTDNMPARPPVDVNLRFLHSVDRQFARWLNELMDAAGLAGPGSGARAA